MHRTAFRRQWTFEKRVKTILPQAQVVDEEMFKSCLRALTKRMAALG